MAAQSDGWTPSTGLFESGKVTITGASFGYDASYNNGEQLLLIIEATTDNAEFPELRQMYSVGGNDKSGRWVAKERGKKAVHESGKVVPFNNRSNVWAWITGAIAAGAKADIVKRGTMHDASVWEGMIFDLGTEDYEKYGDERGKPTGVRVVPVKYYGIAKGAGKTAGKAAAAVAVADDDGDDDGDEGAEAVEVATPTPATKKSPPRSVAGGASKVSPRSKLVKLAGKYDSYDDFYGEAIEVEGVEGSDLEDELEDIYNEAHA